jgi:uncharacterized protein (UPF0218 family)
MKNRRQLNWLKSKHAKNVIVSSMERKYVRSAKHIIIYPRVLLEWLSFGNQKRVRLQRDSILTVLENMQSKFGEGSFVGYKLPISLRKSLRTPIGNLFIGEHSESARNAIKYITKVKRGIVTAVGDVCAQSLLNQGYYPQIIIFDEKTQRTDNVSLNLEDYTIKNTFNPKEWILESAINEIKNAIAFSTSDNCRIAVRIDGEEDLLIIPVIISLPLGSVVIYGQPPIATEEGLVVAVITTSLKEQVQDLLNVFEYHEEYRNGDYDN